MLKIFTKCSFWVCIAASVFSLTVQAAALNEHESLTLDRAVEIALEGNPGLAKLSARAKALATVSAQVGTLPDPVLSLNALNLPNDTFSLSQEAMTQLQVGIGFTLPFPGKLDLREQVAELAARAAEFDADEMRLVLVKNVRNTWWSLFYLDHAQSVVLRNQVLLRQLIRMAETKYKTGEGMQSDVLLAQVELSKLLDIEISLKALRLRQAASLKALLDRPSMGVVTLPDQVMEVLPVAPNLSELHVLALKARPALFAQQSELDVARNRVALAEKDYYPDFKLGAAYSFRSGNNPNGTARTDMSSLLFSMNLPIFSGARQDSALSQRKAEVMREEYAFEDRRVQILTEIEQALTDYQAGQEQASLFKTGIIPQAKQTTASMLSAYQVNKVDFLNLVRSQITLYNYETQYWKALSSAWQAWANLEAAVGKQISPDVQITTPAINQSDSDKEKINE